MSTRGERTNDFEEGRVVAWTWGGAAMTTHLQEIWPLDSERLGKGQSATAGLTADQ